MYSLEELTEIVKNVGSENPSETEYDGVYKEDGYFLMQHYKEYAEFLYIFQ